MSTTGEAGPAVRPLRRDAERNRQRILRAAHTLVAEKGLALSHDELAEAADVAVGTVYRRFPDKASLFEALFRDELDRIVAQADHWLTITDAWQALERFMVDHLEIQATNRGFKDLMLQSAEQFDLICYFQQTIVPIIEELVERGHEARVLRPGVCVQDFVVASIMVGAVIDSARDVNPDLWRRYLAGLLDGFRAVYPAPLPGSPPTADEVDLIKRGCAPPMR
ncbi:TetR/AcrR family transcriptional regulator [Cryptosporangium sp. NPDC051539]|uniref:TetR/AcrR family transcriptional regulator n=1 Tax=Cryptosporangium sp. NPDC051539 TaxID=3363962 RepID=UPI0037AC87D3